MLCQINILQVAEEKLHEQWRINCPELRELESQQLQQAAQEEWENQIETRQQVYTHIQHTMIGCNRECMCLSGIQWSAR